MKKLLWIFMGIPVLIELINSLLFLFGIGPLILSVFPFGVILYIAEVIFSFIIYLVLNKVVQKKCGFSFNITAIYKSELSKRYYLPLELKQNGKDIFLIALLICGSLLFHAMNNYDKYLSTSLLSCLINIAASFLAGFYEEFIFRKMYFEYISDKDIKYPLILNVVCFSFIHLIPYPHVILCGILFAYIYNKYNSLLLNALLHFLVDLLSSCILPIAVKYLHS